MHEDTRFPRGKGRYETRVITASGDLTGVDPLCAGNGARVALIFAAIPDVGATIEASIAIGPVVGGVLVALRTLTVGIAHCALSLERDGDIVFQPMFAQSAGNWLRVAVSEVIWHPEER